MRRLQRFAIVLVPAFALMACPGPVTSEPPGGGGGFGPGLGNVPHFDSPAITRNASPPPLSGGTLIILSDGQTAVASDPDRDQVYVVDLSSDRVAQVIHLQPGDEPGRLVKDSAGRVHVALRSGGAVVTFNPSTGNVIARRDVCAVPRGIAYQANGDRIHVACAGGELVTLPAAGGAALRTVKLERDLRDVIVDGDQLLVSRFKTAELLTIDSNGAMRTRQRAADFHSKVVREDAAFQPAVAWRTIAMPGGGVLMLHQRAFAEIIQVTPGGGGKMGPGGGSSYGGGGFNNCDNAIVHATVTRFGQNGAQLNPSPLIGSAVVPVDIAFAPDGRHLAIVAPGNYKMATGFQLQEVEVKSFDGSADGCVTGTSQTVHGQATAVAYDGHGSIVVQTREPPALEIAGRVIPLPGESREHTGHSIFHSNSGGGIACASCHPEGGEDGRVWQFSNSGPRRTQSLRGNMTAVAPFHWDGDMSSISVLADEVFVNRMGGPKLVMGQSDALQGWIDTIPLLRDSPPADPVAVQRGKQLFEDPAGAACAHCHTGPTLSTRDKVDVGTGTAFRIPTLRGVAWRAPFLHNGCAPTLTDRFGPCGGSAHGITANLAPSQISDLVAYLDTL